MFFQLLTIGNKSVVRKGQVGHLWLLSYLIYMIPSYVPLDSWNHRQLQINMQIAENALLMAAQ